MNKTKEEVLDELKICLKGDCEECDFESGCNKNIACEELIFKNVVELLERYEKMSNRPTITEDDLLKFAHAKGMEEAWDIIKRIDNPRACEEICDMYKHFGVSTFHQILDKFTPHEAKDKIEAWEEQQNICVGDIVVVDTGTAVGKAVVLKVGKVVVTIIKPDGACGVVHKTSLKKTGRHIDLDVMLKQIG